MVFFQNKKRAVVQSKMQPLSKLYTKMAVLGEGTYAKVYKVMDQSGATFAMKEESISDAGEFANESQLLTLLRHPSIVTLYEFGVEAGRNVLVLELVEGGSLNRLLARQTEPLPETTLRSYTRQLLEALEYCHSCGVVHRDLKSSNVLVTETGRLKLADFGGSKRGPTSVAEEALKASATMQMTLLWAAPEQLRDMYTCKSDLWSLGCTVIEMATLQRPWADVKFESNATLLFFLMSQQGGPKIPAHLSPEARDFLSKCFTRDYTIRPSASELLQHPWFNVEDDKDTVANNDEGISTTNEAARGMEHLALSSNDANADKVNTTWLSTLDSSRAKMNKEDSTFYSAKMSQDSNVSTTKGSTSFEAAFHMDHTASMSASTASDAADSIDTAATSGGAKMSHEDSTFYSAKMGSRD